MRAATGASRRRYGSDASRWRARIPTPRSPIRCCAAAGRCWCGRGSIITRLGDPTCAASRTAVAVNVEGSRSLLERRTGPLREVAVFGFADAGLVDSLAIPSSPAGRAATTLYDGGLGLATRHQVGELEWTLRLELPVIVNRWDFARDARPSLGRAAFRWQVSLEPSF